MPETIEATAVVTLPDGQRTVLGVALDRRPEPGDVVGLVPGGGGPESPPARAVAVAEAREGDPETADLAVPAGGLVVRCVPHP